MAGAFVSVTAETLMQTCETRVPLPSPKGQNARDSCKLPTYRCVFKPELCKCIRKALKLTGRRLPSLCWALIPSVNKGLARLPSYPLPHLLFQGEAVRHIPLPFSYHHFHMWNCCDNRCRRSGQRKTSSQMVGTLSALPVLF